MIIISTRQDITIHLAKDVHQNDDGVMTVGTKIPVFVNGVELIENGLKVNNRWR